MRLGELIGADVVAEDGTGLGVVHDVRGTIEPGEPWEVAGIVVDRPGWSARAAHSWGYAEGRSQGPGLFARLFAGARARARFVPVADIVEWAPGRVRVAAQSYPTLAEELDR